MNNARDHKQKGDRKGIETGKLLVSGVVDEIQRQLEEIAKEWLPRIAWGGRKQVLNYAGVDWALLWEGGKTS